MRAHATWNSVTARTLFLRGTTDKWVASESAQSTGPKPSRATSSRSQSNRDGLGKEPFLAAGLHQSRQIHHPSPQGRLLYNLSIQSEESFGESDVGSQGLTPREIGLR
jgi:hypothetical protein